MTFSVSQLAQVLATVSRLDSPSRYWVGFSGGLDSTVLLHALWRLQPPQELVAVHVNHRLHPDADEWAGHCRQVCRDWNVPLQVVEVNAKARRGESPEAAARQARYAAFQDLLGHGDYLLTAQHQDDQAETLLLQLLRGGGPAGLAAMPLVGRFAAGYLARPLLPFDRRALRVYAEGEDLKWIDDSSNAALEFDRNYLRHEILPVLKTRWPGYPKTLARVARHQAEAAALLSEMAENDFATVQGTDPAALSVSRLREFSGPRQRNAVRHWLGKQALDSPTEAVLNQIIALLDAAPDRCPAVVWRHTEVRRYRDDIFFLRRVLENPVSPTYLWAPGTELTLPELGLTLNRRELEKQGLVLPDTDLQVRFRRGGERIVLPGRRHSHSLKKLLQQRGVPPWLRQRLPLIYAGERLLAVLGLTPPIVAGGGVSRSGT
ncbi:MAG TPA: tRNA lysidine(34) synthetase TilS [Gammaproteobacteria bacterium]